MLTLGVACLVVAAVSFGALNWDSFDASMRAGLLVGATVASLFGGMALRRRGLSGTATALSWLTAVLLFVDLFAVHKAAFPNASLDGFTAIGGVVLFGIFAGLAWLTRDTAMAIGAAIAWVMCWWSAFGYWNWDSPDLWLLPVAAAIGYFQWHAAAKHEAAGSWGRYGLTLLVVAVPEVLTSLAASEPLRPIIVITVATLVLLTGVRFRQLAAVWIGGATIGVLVAAQFVDVLRGVPGWAVFALVGVVLLGVGAGFEYRLRLAARAANAELDGTTGLDGSATRTTEGSDRTLTWN